MDQQQTTPTLAQVMGTLDELAAAARAADADRYRAAVRLAQGQQITEEQQRGFDKAELCGQVDLGGAAA